MFEKERKKELSAVFEFEGKALRESSERIERGPNIIEELSESELVNRMNNESFEMARQIERDIEAFLRCDCHVSLSFTRGSVAWFGIITAVGTNELVASLANIGGATALIALVAKSIHSVLVRKIPATYSVQPTQVVWVNASQYQSVLQVQQAASAISRSESWPNSSPPWAAQLIISAITVTLVAIALLVLLFGKS
jgi:hypothetical protein